MSLTPTEFGFLDETSGEVHDVEGSLRQHAAGRFLEARSAAKEAKNEQDKWSDALLALLDGEEMRHDGLLLRPKNRRIPRFAPRQFAESLPELNRDELLDVIAAGTGYKQGELPEIARASFRSATHEGASAYWIEVEEER